jgi:hypothetical protein
MAEISRAKLRDMLNKLPTDEEFMAFCKANFPDVWREFGSGMTRTAKTTLLLRMVDTKVLFQALLKAGVL